MYAYSDMDCLHRHNFLSFQAIFCFFAQLLTTTIIMWQKCKKTPGYIILLHMCTINQDHMMYGSWDMKFNRQNFLVILHPEKWKHQKWKNPWRYHHFTQVYQKSWSSAIYCSRDMTHGRCNCYFHFGLSDIFPSTFLQPVYGCKNSILNSDIKLNLIKLPMKFYISKKNCFRCRQTMCRLCFRSQGECRK